MTKTLLFAVAGKPVLHSKSPNLFNSAFAAMGIDAAYMRLAASSAQDAVTTFKSLGLTGMNVTAPFKEEIMPLMDVISDEARIIGGVNTVFMKDGKLMGCNTDHHGVAQSVLQAGYDLAGMACCVVGPGGAGKAAAYGLHAQGAAVTIVNRTASKAQDAASAIGCQWDSLENMQQVLAGCRLVVFSLSPDVNPINPEWINSNHIIFDANYKHSEFSAVARQRGCAVIEGLQWLLNQAIPAFRYFFGYEPDAQAMAEGPQLPLSSKAGCLSLIGFMGAGKTSNGKMLAKKLERSFSDTDKLISENQNCSIPELFAEKGEAFFRQLEQEILIKQTQNKDRHILSCGGGIVTVAENRKILSLNTVPIWLYASPEAAVRRIKPGSRPLLDVPDPVGKAREILTQRLGWYAQSCDLIINTDHRSHDQIVDTLYEEIITSFGN